MAAGPHITGAANQRPSQHGGKGHRPRNPKPNLSAAQRAANKAENNALTPLTMQQIRRQAQKTVNAGYKSSYTQLGQQDTQAQNLYAKQQADNQYFQQWLDSKTAALQQQQNQVDGSTNALEQQLTGNTQAAFANQQQDLTQQANAREGNISNNAESTPLTTGIAQNQTNQNLFDQAAGTQNLQEERATNAFTNATALNDTAYVQTGRQTQLQNLNAALTGDANTRTTLSQKKAGDLQTAITNLQAQNATIAQNNRAFAAAQQAAGLSAANTLSEIKDRQDTAHNRDLTTQNTITHDQNLDKLSLARLRESLSHQQQEAMAQNRTYQLDLAKFGAQQATARYEKAHGLGVYNPHSGTSSSRGSLTLSEQNTIYQKISGMVGAYHQLISAGHTPQQAYQLMKNGYTIGAHQVIPAHGKPYTVGGDHIPPIGDVRLLNAAYSVGRVGSLDPGDVAALKGMGLAHPGKRYGVHKPVKNPARGAYRGNKT